MKFFLNLDHPYILKSGGHYLKGDLVKITESIRFYTIFYEVFNELYELFYPNNNKIKIVPIILDIYLIPRAITYWFKDDEHIYYGSYGKLIGFKF